MEDTLGVQTYRFRLQLYHAVLILVLMEDTLGVKNFEKAAIARFGS